MYIIIDVVVNRKEYCIWHFDGRVKYADRAAPARNAHFKNSYSWW